MLMTLEEALKVIEGDWTVMGGTLLVRSVGGRSRVIAAMTTDTGESEMVDPVDQDDRRKHAMALAAVLQAVVDGVLV